MQVKTCTIHTADLTCNCSQKKKKGPAQMADASLCRQTSFRVAPCFVVALENQQSRASSYTHAGQQPRRGRASSSSAVRCRAALSFVCHKVQGGICLQVVVAARPIQERTESQRVHLLWTWMRRCSCASKLQVPRAIPRCGLGGKIPGVAIRGSPPDQVPTMDPGLPDCCQTVSFVCSFVWVAVSPFGMRKIRIPNRREIALFGDA